MAELTVERRGGVARVTLDRPPLNLLTPPLITTLRDTFIALAQDERVRVVVLTGQGRALSGGMQLQVLRDLTPATARELITLLHEAIQAVHEAPFVTICAINGPCLGAAFELAMACDLRIASEHAALGLPEIRVGIPSVIEAALLPRLVGPGRAAECLLLGEPLEARRALDWGLINRVVPREQLEAATRQLVDQLLALAPGALRLQKALIVRWRDADLPSAVAHGVEAFTRAYTTPEPREAMAAFLEKRLPGFRAQAEEGGQQAGGGG